MDVADSPTRTTGRLTAAFQVIICCGQLPTQTAIAAALLAFGVPADLREWTEVGDFHTDVGGFQP